MAGKTVVKNLKCNVVDGDWLSHFDYRFQQLLTYRYEQFLTEDILTLLSK